MRPRTAVLWIPLVLGYWLTLGVRASFFVPSELPSSWLFRLTASEIARSRGAAVRASMIAYVVPRTLAVAALLAIPLGGRLAAWHALLVGLTTILLIEVVAPTIADVPFTRPYRPGHTKLKTRWPLYLLGLFTVADWPVRLEIRLLGHPEGLAAAAASMAIAVAALEILGRWRADRHRRDDSDEDVDDEASGLSVLGLAGVVESARPAG